MTYGIERRYTKMVVRERVNLVSSSRTPSGDQHKTIFAVYSTVELILPVKIL
jgi:hypothetical protein